jgi:hypothetical protein
MNRPKHIVSMILLLIAGFLLVKGSASAKGGVIHYWGDDKVELSVSRDGLTSLPYIPLPPHPLPGGRGLIEGWLAGSRYTADPGVTTDLISGNWYFTVNAIIQPSGVMKAWGSGVSYLDEFGGKGCEEEDGGGWVGTFHGTLVPNGAGAYDAVINGNNTGCGELQGWTMKHQEVWYADGRRTFSGHFKPAK